jgi:hypothetical protein
VLLDEWFPVFKRIMILSSSGSDMSKRIKKILLALFNPDDEATQNFEVLQTANCPPNNMASYPKRHESLTLCFSAAHSEMMTSS